MEKQNDDILMKARSYRSVLATGFRLYMANFRRLFKASWQMALLYAVACGCLGTLCVIKIPEVTVTITRQLMTFQGIFIEPLLQYGLTLLEMFGLMLLAIATLTLASAPILSKLKEHKETGSITTPPHWLTASPHLMGRTLKGVFLTLFVMLLPMLLCFGLMYVANLASPQIIIRHYITTVITLGVCTVIALLLELPLFHVLMKYIMEAPCGYWRTLRNNYGSGMRHWSGIFLVFFVSLLLVEIASLIVMLPSHILSFANQQAQMGQLLGDPLGMPSYMTWLTFITFLLCCFIQFYISQVTLVHNYYIYGSIEAREQERAENQSLNTQL